MPNSTVMQAINITMLLMTRADVLLMNNKFNCLFELGDLIIKSINENPVITKNIINIKIPRDESVAKV